MPMCDPDTIAVLEEHRDRALQPAKLLDVASIDEWYLFSSDPAHGRPLNPDWVSTGHAFVQNLRRGHYDLGLDIDRPHRLPAASTELARAIWRVIESINDTFKGQLSLEQDGGHTPAGVWVRVAQTRPSPDRRDLAQRPHRTANQASLLWPTITDPLELVI